jgi:TonB-linked outer membrane protein, SusC/RagA family/TonB-dependent outer membrane receptor, SusC/RagA subfamily, signature region
MKSKISYLRGLVTALLLAFVLSASAQVTVTGIVQDKSGEPLIGATVQEKGNTTNGSATGFDGDFSLKVKSADATLLVSYVGMKSQEVPLNGRTNVTVTLEDDSEVLDEVVVVGYGTMKKSDLAGASTSLGEDAMKGSVITNLDQSLQGRATGVQAVATSGAPGSSSSIRVRGQATINANAEPLYVIDGVIVQGGGNSGSSFGLGDALGNGKVSTISPLSTINPSDIVSMEILKDASATAIYGAQGSNGVVLITTKRGKSGEAKFTYDGMVAWNHQSKRLDMMNLREFASYYNDLVATGQQKENNVYRDPSILGVGTNWQDAVFRTALQQQHQIAAQGGTDKVQYYVSGSYMDQEGTLIGSDFRRFSLRANLDAQLKSWLKLGLSSTYSDIDENLKLADGEEGIINYSLTTVPDIPIYDIDGNYSSVVREGYTNPNPVALAMLDEIKLSRRKLTGNFFFDVTPIKNLTWHAEFDYDVSQSQGKRFKPTVDLGGWVRSANSSSIQDNNSWFWAVKNYVTYNGEWDKLSYNAMVGQECWESHYDYASVSNTGLPSNEVHNPALGTGTPTISAGWGSSSMASFFTRETLNWDGRYMLTYTYRYDGSSNFGPKNRWAGFHSVAGAWRFSNEKFFGSVSDWFNNGKLRIGWGQTGNANIGAFAWGVAMSRMPSALGAGYRPANIANEAVKWEKQEQWNLGLDLAFLNNRITFTGDLYYKTSKDMLMSMQLPSYMGTQGNGSSALAAPKGNFGEIVNKGLELELTGRPFVGEFEWETSVQFSFNRNKLKALTGTKNANLVGYGQWSDVVSVSEIGQPLYNFYGYVVEGVYKDLADIQNSPKSDKYPTNGVFNSANTVWPGDLKFKDVNGDGKIDENDRTVIGNPMPDFTFGWNNTFRYKNFDLSIFINGSYGNDVMNYLSIGLTHMNSAWSNQLNTVNDRARLVPIDPSKVYPAGQFWYNDINNVMVANPGTKIPRAVTADPNDNDRISDRYIEDGSYIRLKNISLGYTFDSKMLRKIGLQSLRVYANIQNLWTITGYDGYDPEVGASTQDSSGLVYGLDFGRYPSPTVYSFGLNISL